MVRYSQLSAVKQVSHNLHPPIFRIDASDNVDSTASTPLAVSLSERDRQRLDNRSMTRASTFHIPTGAPTGLNPTETGETPDICICNWVLTAVRDPSCDGREVWRFSFRRLPKLVSLLVSFKSVDVRIVGLTERYPSTLQLMICLGALRPLSARESYFLLSLSPSRIDNTQRCSLVTIETIL